MGLKSAEQIIFFDFCFLLLLGLFGPTVTALYGNPQGIPSLTAISSIPQPQLAPLPQSSKCAFADFACNASKDIVLATAFIGWAIINGPVLFIYFISVMIGFLDLDLSIMFTPQFSPNGVPVVFFIFTALQLAVAFEIFRMFRGSSSGF